MTIIDMHSALGLSKDACQFEHPAITAHRFSGGAWEHAPHLDLISHAIAEMEDHPLRLIITVPPRHGKSELCSHWTPVWCLKKHPDWRIILASYEATFAATWGRKVRNTINENKEGLELEVAGDSSAAAQWELKGHSGGMTTAGVNGPITGKGANVLLIDDPIKNIAEAYSPVYQKAIYDWFITTAYTRLEPGGSVIIIMTRWHYLDLVGRILSEQSEQWKVINLPALAEPNDALGRPEGAALWPKRYDETALARIREVEGPRFWIGLYQQRPSREEGATFKLVWWDFLKAEPLIEYIIQIWDTAFSEKGSSDFSACVTLGRIANGYTVMDVWRDRLAYPDLYRAVIAKHQQFRPNKVLVEDAASGQSLIQSLTRDTRLPIIGVKPEGSKELRAEQVTGIVEARRVKLPQAASWLGMFLDEMTSFPTGAHDDIVDAFVHGLKELAKAPTPLPPQPKAKTDQGDFVGLRDKNF